MYEKRKDWGFIVCGDFNHFEYLWDTENTLNLRYENLNQGTHINMLNLNQEKSNIQRIYTKKLQLEVKIIKEVIERKEKISDHAMILIICKNKKIEPGEGGRMIIQNSKISEKIKDLIKDGENWENIHKLIYTNEKMLKIRTKPIKDIRKEECMKS